MWSCITDFFTYETTKSVVVKSWTIGIINRVVQLLIIIYFIGSVPKTLLRSVISHPNLVDHQLQLLYYLISNTYR
uniref:Very-long-chain (3R)-3-hydroxyacyl-CoA dehydratase n=1 Tax=Esox lucius TaxID=8010 RepID=A0AAY5KSD8_ESOLU